MTPTGPYGYRLGDDRQILVHVVAPEGWTRSGAFAMCGAGLDRDADWPGQGQKWCRRCTDDAHRHITDTRWWPAGPFPGQTPSS